MSTYRRLLRVRKFHDLMPYRIREVLLVSSPYDAFILEQDGQLTEQLFFEYRDASLLSPPRVTHVPSGEAAIRCLERQRFDLILAMTSLADSGVNAFGRRVKELRPGRAVVLLALDRKELEEIWDLIDPEAIDGAFLWTGDSQILLAIIEYIEDRSNVEHDIQHGDVRVIIVLEDSPRDYSSFLGMLYKELMKQSRSLYLEGANELDRRMHARSRPKVLHATSFDKGVELLQRYKRNVMGIISDMRVPRAGKLHPQGGLDFVRFARRDDPDLPVLLLSAEAENAKLASAMGAAFLHKASPTLLADIRRFLQESLGFGDFVFRLPDGQEVDRARDLRELEQKLVEVPEESIVYHGSHNHFSIWLMARCEFELAERLRPKKVSDFSSIEETRRYLLEALKDTHRWIYTGSIADFSHEHFDRDSISRIDQGSLGGKARGLAFLNMRLANTDAEEFGGLPVSVPKTVAITTERFDRFIEDNRLLDRVLGHSDDRQITRSFVEAALPEDLLQDLRFVCERLEGPLAVRSSSLLEDSMHQPFAGVYKTLMIPNNGPDLEIRTEQLARAVKLVYASTFLRRARSYLENAGYRVEEEKMAVIVQRVVGRRLGDRFYPTFSGLAQSHNYYPIGPQRPEEGVVHLALGLGRMVVDGGLALRFSPRHPEVVPQLADPKRLLDNSQRGFYAIDMRRDCCGYDADLETTVRYFELAGAEEDGTLFLVASVYSAEEQRIRDDLSLAGPRLVTFNNILKHKAIPLAPALVRLLQIGEEGLGCPVEIEFAGEMGDWGRSVRAGVRRTRPELFALQVRPFGPRAWRSELIRIRFARDDCLCVSRKSLGHGVDEQIRDVVFVRRDRWDRSRHKAIAAEVGQLNHALTAEARRYLLIGPGRWGTADEWLGIPVDWADISNVRVIVEASPSGYDIEPSQGTHFFQNITSFGVGYLTLPAGASGSDPRQEEFLDWQWLEAQPPWVETEHLRHVRLDEPLTVVLDGQTGRGTIAKPGVNPSP